MKIRAAGILAIFAWFAFAGFALAFLSGLAAIPAACVGGWQVQQVQHAIHAMVHDIKDGFRLVVEARDRRQNNGSHFRKRYHSAQMSQM